MIKKVVKHIPHYISLFGIFMAALLAFYFFSYDRFFLSGVSVAVAASYVSWGVIHHLIHKDLYPAVVIEYIAVSVLGLVIVLSLIFRT